MLLLVWAAMFCFRKPTKVKNMIFVMIAFTQFFIIMAFRYRVGVDYNMYAVGFRDMAEKGFSQLSYLDWEPGFVIFNKLLGLIPGMDYQWYMVILSVIAIVPMALFIIKNSEVPWISTILYMNLFMFFMEMNFLRQMIAVSILLLAWHFLKKNGFIIYTVLIIIASLFHQTILVMIPVYFLVKFKPGLKELFIYGFFLLWFYTASSDFFDLITTMFHEEYNDSIFIKTGVALIYSILPLFVTIVSFLLVKTETINLTRENKYLVNLTFIGTLLMLTMAKHSIIERLSYFFIPFMLLLVPVIYRSLKTKGIYYVRKNEKVIDLTAPRKRTIMAVVFLLLVLALSYVHLYYGLFENAHGAMFDDGHGSLNYRSWVSWLNFI